MRTIFADFNAMIEPGRISLTTRGSLEDMTRLAVGVGDWTWLGDGELIVGARVEDDPYHGLVASPAWDTLVHLDDEGADDIDRTWTDLLPLLEGSGDRLGDEPRVFQLLVVLETIVPASTLAFPNELTLRRAGALDMMGHPELALLEIEDARRGGVVLREHFLPLYLDILRRTDLGRAKDEAEVRAASEAASATLLSSCIDVYVSVMARPDGERIEQAALRILGLAERFESAPGRERVPASILARVLLGRGLAQIGLGRRDDARRSFELAHLIDPADPALGDARDLAALGPRAWEIAASVRDKPFAA